jgi:hypothetical protein
MGRRGYQPADLVVELGRLGGQHPLAVACSVWPWCVAGEVPAGTGTATLLNVRERHLSISHELPVALALLTTRLLHSMVEVVVEGDHGVVGRRVANLQGALVVGAASVRSPRSAGTVPGLLCRVAMLGWSAP